MLFRNQFFDLKSDMPKMNTNVMKLFLEIFEKKYLNFKVLLNLKFKINFLRSLDILSTGSYIY